MNKDKTTHGDICQNKGLKEIKILFFGTITKYFEVAFYFSHTIKQAHLSIKTLWPQNVISEIGL